MRQIVTAPWWWRILGCLLIAAFGGSTCFFLWLAGEGEPAAAFLSGLPTLLGLVLGVVLLIARIELQAEDTGVTVVFFPIYRRTIPWASLGAVEVVESSWFEFGGVGLRFRGDRTGLIVGDRLAIAIDTRNRRYVVQITDPEGAAAWIRENRPTAGSASA